VNLHRSKLVAAKESKEKGISSSPGKLNGPFSDTADGNCVEKSVDMVVPFLMVVFVLGASPNSFPCQMTLSFFS
jgi:hypothetical protein